MAKQIFDNKIIYNINDIKEKVIPICKKYKVNKALLFGSYAKNTMNKNSDVDILVDSGLRGMAFFGLLEDLTTELKKRIDLIDTYEIETNSPIYNEINNTGIILYEK